MSPTAVQNTRVAARRLRVLLHIYRKQFDSEEGKRHMRHLKGLTRDLEVAREADVTRHAIRQLGRNRRGRMNSNARALHERAVTRYDSAIYGLRLALCTLDIDPVARPLPANTAAARLVRQPAANTDRDVARA